MVNCIAFTYFSVYLVVVMSLPKTFALHKIF